MNLYDIETKLLSYIWEFPDYANEVKTGVYTRGRVRWLYFVLFPFWFVFFRRKQSRISWRMFHAYTERKYIR